MLSFSWGKFIVLFQRRGIMVQAQEWTTGKLSARLKVILLVANDDATLPALAHVLSQELHSHIFVASAHNLIGFSKPFDLDDLITTIETLFATFSSE
jgi:hypothetical protein